MRRAIRVATASAAAVAVAVASKTAAVVSAPLLGQAPTTALSTINTKTTTRYSYQGFVCGQSTIPCNTTPAHTIHRLLRKEHHQPSRSIWRGGVIGSCGVSFAAFGGDRVYGCKISSTCGNSYSQRGRLREVPVLSVNSSPYDDYHRHRRPRPTLMPIKSTSGESGSDDGTRGRNHLTGAGTELTRGEQQHQQQQPQQHQPPPKQGQQREWKGGRGGRRPFSHITDETLDLIRSSTSIIEVIGQHVKMKPAGRGMVGCCPFHDDRNPSFSVDESRGSYHCFGCGARGDVIQFVMQMEGLGFREAVRELAEEAGVSLHGAESSSSLPGSDVDDASQGVAGGSGERGGNNSGDEKERREARERLNLVLQMAAQFYTRCLVEMPAAGIARAHLLERGISPMTVMDFQLGYSPADLTSPLIEYLDQEGFEMETLVDAGLVPDTSKWKYPVSPGNPKSRVDRFRGRLVVPIRDHRGTVIGFGARDLSDSQAQGNVGSGFVIPEETETSGVPTKKKPKGRKSKGKKSKAKTAVSAGAAGADSLGEFENKDGGAVGNKAARPPAKYLNSPETSLFKKGKNVFGLDLAKETIRSEDMAVVVEGYFDVIKMHDAGLRCAVGVLGTAITVDQLMLCARYSRSKRVVLCMDGDAAGQRAVERLCESPASSGLDSLAEAGVSISVASIPGDSGCKDPADFLQMHGALEFRTRVVDRAVPWSDWYGDRILSEHDFASDANAFRRCTDRLTGFISDLSIPTDQTFHVHRFARALARGNEVMQHQLEFDLMNMSNEKRARKNALRRRVASPAAPPPSSGNPGMTSSLSPVSLAPPSPPPPAAELRRLTSGRSTDEWDVVSGGRKSGARGSLTRSRAAGVLEGGDGPVMRDHEWVMERVKTRKRESSRRKRGGKFDAYGSVWSPSEDQRFEEEDAAEPGLRGPALYHQILDKAQRFLLTLAVHDPSRRLKCRQEASRHGLSLGSERRQWLFDAVTRSPSQAKESVEKHPEENEDKKWKGPSAEALEAGGEALFAEIRAVAPVGYFEVQGRFGSKGGDKGEEETLDWVFDDKEAERVAAGKNTDLVLLEVVMVMLKEQAAAKMHSLSLELASIGDAIARAMAEAAAAGLLSLPGESLDVNGKLDGDEGEGSPAVAVDGGGGGGGVGGRSKAEAQAEVVKLKARQAELFGLIRDQREEVASLEAQRRAFTSGLPRVKAESEAFRDDQPRVEAGAIESRDLGKEGVPAGGDDVKESMSSLPMVFVDEDQDPEDGVSIFDVEANVAAARAANAAAAAAAASGGVAPSAADDASGESSQPEKPQRQTSDDESDASLPTFSFRGAPEKREAASRPQQPRAMQSGRARDDLSLRPSAPSSAKSGVERGVAAARETPVSSEGGWRQPSREPRRSDDRGVWSPREVSEERSPTAGGEGDTASRRERARAAAAAAAEQNASSRGGFAGVSLPPLVVTRAAGSSSRREGRPKSDNEERMAREAEELAEMVEEGDAFEPGWTT